MLRFVLFILMIPCAVQAQKKVKVNRVDPMNWWIGMENKDVELLIYAPGIGNFNSKNPTFDIKAAPGMEVVSFEAAENKDYAYLTFRINDEAKAGIHRIRIEEKANKLTCEFSFELKQRNRDKMRVQGLSTRDFIYLIMPDRFANGNTSNDIIVGTEEASINRDSMFHRHGGDIEGIRRKIPYLKELGVTALWLNPVQENNQPKASYHGYAITDHYRIDPRFGDNALYKTFVDECHANGLKVIMDIVPNHIGDRHYLFKNLPSKDWVHQYATFTKTSYRAPTLLDPYASEADKSLMTDGWFDRHMPDLNQKNPHVARYLTQSYIWWVEFSGLDGFRIDTYAYPDQEYMAEMTKDILKEYPQIGMFAEIWEHGVGIQAFFLEKNEMRKGFDSKLPSAVDFQFYKAINEVMTKPFNWTDGASFMYYTLAQDYMYHDPMKLVNFLDNHDLSRYYSVVGEDMRKFKAGINILLTMRGIPSLYYGTEILMKNFSDPDGKVREDFPGGWPGDAKNKFEAAARNEFENEAFNHVKQLARYRLTSDALQNGKLIQFVPEKGVYVYFRKENFKRVMVVTNCSDKTNEISLARFDEVMMKDRNVRDIASGKTLFLEEEFKLEPWESKVYEIIPTTK